MKILYQIAIFLLFILLLLWILQPAYFGSFINRETIQGSGIIVALIAAITALGVSDAKKFVKVKVEVFVDEIDNTFKTNNLPKKWCQFGEEVNFYRTNFKLTNNSGFTLRNPTLTFKLPREKRSLQKVDNGYQEGFNSNIFNSRERVRFLEFANKLIISNSNLPYLNHKEVQAIWFILFFGDMTPFTVELSINCENAEGITKNIEIKPRELLNNFNNKN